MNFQYVARDNIVSRERHVDNILALIRFQKELTNVQEIEESKRDCEMGEMEL